MGGSLHPEFINKNNLQEFSHMVEFVDPLFNVYKENRAGYEMPLNSSLLNT